MKNFLKNQREFLSLISYVLFLALLVWVVILPLISKINNVKDKIQEEQINQESSRERLSELPKIRDQYLRLQNNSNIVDVLFDKNNAVPAIEKLEKLAEDSGNRIVITVQDQATGTGKSQVVNPKAKIQDNALLDGLPSSNYLQLKISLNGNLNSIVNFVGLLESFEYYCDITNIQIKKSTEPLERKKTNDDLIIANPFESNDLKKEIASQTNENNLEANLDVVFYSK